MSSFLKPNKTRNRPGFQIKPRGASATGSRIHDVLHRMERENARSASPAEGGPSSSVEAPTSSRPKCPNAQCPNPYAPISEGFCTGCGREIDASNIVAEVTFGETSTGAAIVQGSYIGADQGTSRMASGLSRRIGGVIGDEKERKIREARNMMLGFQTQLRTITESTVDMGVQIFKLAINENWIQGRGMDKVVPVCLYTACRREPQCQVMLIDFADLVKINVYELGHVFKNLNDIYSFQSHDVKAVLPEDLMYRFASKLDFGDLTNRVAEDAIRLCQRMGRDWMVMGRRPSGICGACLLMAARMWHFRRTVREVVYVVKVTTATIQQRLGEFTVTASSEMSIEDFLNREFLDTQHNPPAYYKHTDEWREKIEKEREASGRKRKRIVDIDDDDAARSEGIEGSRASSVTTDMPPPPIPRPPPDLSRLPKVSQFLPRSFDDKEKREFYQFDPELLAAAAIPKATVDKDVAEGLIEAEDPQGDAAVDGLARAYGEGGDEEEAVEEQQGSRRGKKKRQEEEPTLTFDEQWERDEVELERQISEIVNDPHTEQHRKAYATAAHMASINAEWARSQLTRREIKMDEIIGENEFEGDPEVDNCQLSDEEAKIKEMIWLNQNKEWLRKQQEKQYRKQMEELGPPKRRRNRLKRPRIGEGQLTPASTPGEAAVEAMKKRGFSKRINYDAITSLFSDDNRANRGPGSTVASLLGDEPGSQRASRAASVASASTHKSASRTEAQPAKGTEPEAEAEEEQEDDTAPLYDDEEVEHPGYDEDEYYDQDEEEFY